jgi:hypothetical protein
VLALLAGLGSSLTANAQSNAAVPAAEAANPVAPTAEAPHPSMQATEDKEGVIVLSNRSRAAAREGEPATDGAERSTNAVPASPAPASPAPENAATTAPPRETNAAADPALATSKTAVAAPAASNAELPTKISRKYLAIELAVVGLLLVGLVVISLVRLRRRRVRAVTPAPRLDQSLRPSAREPGRDATGAPVVPPPLPEGPPPASIRTPITPPPRSADLRGPSSGPLSQPASRPPSGDLGAALLRATVPPPPSQRQWLSQRPQGHKDQNS